MKTIEQVIDTLLSLVRCLMKPAGGVHAADRHIPHVKKGENPWTVYRNLPATVDAEKKHRYTHIMSKWFFLTIMCVDAL